MAKCKTVEKVRVDILAEPFGGGGSKDADATFRERFSLSGWTDDPRDGKAVLNDQGYEVVNPIPVSPPMGYVETPDMMTLVHQQVVAHLRQLGEAEEIDSPEEWEDFDLPEEIDPWSIYEVREMVDESPALPRDGGTINAAPSHPEPLPSAPESGAAGKPEGSRGS